MIRVIIPDSHGSYISQPAMKAFIKDLKALDPDEIVMLGDHVDCSGVLSSHPKTSLEDLEYSYMRDIECANIFLDAIQANAKKATIHYIQGNHEQRCEKWALGAFDNDKDVKYVLSHFAPEILLKLRDRQVHFYRMHQFYQGLTVPGTIKLGKCYFVHGISANKHAAATHVERFGANIVFGHIHRVQSYVSRTVAAGDVGAWCPGTLAELQPTYQHSSPTNWSHGYGIQFVNKPTGSFLHLNVPIIKGQSLLLDLTSKMS